MEQGRLGVADTAAERPAEAKVDRPLSGKPFPPDRLHLSMYFSELVGTALLVFVGLSIVVALWGHGAPLTGVSLSPSQRRFVSGFLFGSVGAAIAYSPIGRISGAHINPAMTLAFWLEDKMKWRDAGCYLLAQLLGAVLGSAVLLVWGQMGASNHWGASVPGEGLPVWVAVAGEITCTFLLVLLIFIFASRKRTQPFTPLVNPVLFAFLVWLEGPLSGASANPARSFGPALIGSTWQGWWVYWLGPMLGAALAVVVTKLEVLGHHRPHQARLFHFGHHGGTGRSGAIGGSAG